MFDYLAAPAQAPGITGGQIFGTVLTSGVALCAGVGLILGLRGSDWGPLVINNKKKAAWWGIFTGTAWMAAGGTWADIAKGIGSVPTALLSGDNGFGNPGLGAIAVVLTMIAFGGKWGSKTTPPAVIGLAASVVYASAGGIWGILVNVIHMLIGIVTGLGH
ncbi:hypothetical protein DI272_18990 [Streptomyces sp. Act143]|uniref:hypothetical protein n=1 Tax=Streptomyces sp. Act143 TaxID=2200760 RepID=UPI000D673CC3|nr:hypothetical protein [Streptomyces sp. Act143]PWI16020.1 hypothetical protein DI272_18990 [Streptomyces sp. Act143]